MADPALKLGGGTRVGRRRRRRGEGISLCPSVVTSPLPWVLPTTPDVSKREKGSGKRNGGRPPLDLWDAECWTRFVGGRRRRASVSIRVVANDPSPKRGHGWGDRMTWTERESTIHCDFEYPDKKLELIHY